MSWVTSHTRPDALFANNMVARYPIQPTQYDMKRALRVAHYLIGTMDLRLCIGGMGGVQMFATVDTSYATHADLKSHSMWTLHLGTGGAFISRTKKHSIMTDSSTYAELVGAHLSIRDIQWARNFLKEIGYKNLKPTLLLIDNQSTLKIIAKQHHAGKTKHVDIRYKMITEKVTNGEIVCEHLPTHIMISDIGTKALAPKVFIALRPYLLGHETLPIILERLGIPLIKR